MAPLPLAPIGTTAEGDLPRTSFVDTRIKPEAGFPPLRGDDIDCAICSSGEMGPRFRGDGNCASG